MSTNNQKLLEKDSARKSVLEIPDSSKTNEKKFKEFWDSDEVCCFFCFYFLLAAGLGLSIFIISSQSNNFYLPCNVTVPIDVVKMMKTEIIRAQKDLTLLHTVINYKIMNKEPTDESYQQFQNISANKAKLEEEYVGYKNQYFECYKTNIIERQYHPIGYAFAMYYILMTINHAKMLFYTRKNWKTDLTEEQQQEVDQYDRNVKISWMLHLIVSPFIFFICFYHSDISKLAKQEFPLA